MRVACTALVQGADGRRRECGRVFDAPTSRTPCPECRVRGRIVPWPTVEQLEAAGFVRCEHDGCSVFVNPGALTEAERRERVMCMAHRRQRRGGHRRPRAPYIPRDRRMPARA